MRAKLTASKTFRGSSAIHCRLLGGLLRASPGQRQTTSSAIASFVMAMEPNATRTVFRLTDRVESVKDVELTAAQKRGIQRVLAAYDATL